MGEPVFGNFGTFYVGGLISPELLHPSTLPFSDWTRPVKAPAKGLGDFAGFVPALIRGPSGFCSPWLPSIATKAQSALGFSDFEPFIPPIIGLEFDQWLDTQQAKRRSPSTSDFTSFVYVPVIPDIDIADLVARYKKKRKRLPYPDYIKPRRDDEAQDPIELPPQPNLFLRIPALAGAPIPFGAPPFMLPGLAASPPPFRLATAAELDQDDDDVIALLAELGEL